MKQICRMTFLKEIGRWGALAGLAGIGAVLGLREKKFSCNDQCGHCPKYEHGKCGIGLK